MVPRSPFLSCSPNLRDSLLSRLISQRVFSFRLWLGAWGVLGKGYKVGSFRLRKF